MKNTILFENPQGSAQPGSQFQIRWIGPALDQRRVLDSPGSLARIWAELVAPSLAFDPAKEHFVLVACNRHLHFIGWHFVAVGGAGEVAFTLRDVFRAALGIDAEALAVMHNHPSGILRHSPQDRQVTEGVKKWCRALGIRFLDHVVVDSEGLNFRASSELVAPTCAPVKPLPKLELVSDAEESVEVIGPAEVLTLEIPAVWLKEAGGIAAIQAGVVDRLAGVAAREIALSWARTDRLKYLAKYARARKRQVSAEIGVPKAAAEAVRVAAAELGLAQEEVLLGVVGAAVRKVIGNRIEWLCRRGREVAL